MTDDPLNPQRMLKKIRGEEDTGGEEGLLSPHHVFDVDYEIKEGPQRGQRLKGRFEFAVPTAGKKIEIARMKAMYLPQGGMADMEGALLVEMISFLACTLTKSPPWWKPTTFWDTGVISVVYKEAVDYEARFLGKESFVREDAESAEDEGEDFGGLGADGEGDVDGDLPPSRKRREVLTADDS